MPKKVAAIMQALSPPGAQLLVLQNSLGGGTPFRYSKVIYYTTLLEPRRYHSVCALLILLPGGAVRVFMWLVLKKQPVEYMIGEGG